MRENFLHYLWKFKKFDALRLKSTSNELIELINGGQHNFDSGPDFFDARLIINGQFWAGNVELHVRSSDWYLHKHEHDPAYQNVILHVVWEHDADVYRSDGTVIAAVELRHFVNQQYLLNYRTLFNKPSNWINCEKLFPEIDNFYLQNWLERLYLERLERKSLEIEALLVRSNNDWEAVLFKMMARNFGLKLNGQAFFDLANSIDFSIIRKEQNNLVHLEALFFGVAGLLNEGTQDNYMTELKKMNAFLNQKYKLSNPAITTFKFFRLRPSNFPTIRISQFANLYYRNRGLFSKVINSSSIAEYYELFSAETSDYWQTHYKFGKTSKKTEKKLTANFIDLILINLVIPLKFSYAKHQGQSTDREMMELITKISSEKNSIISRFNALNDVSQSALQSQALIELKNNYCDKNKCLHCNIGHRVIANSIIPDT